MLSKYFVMSGVAIAALFCASPSLAQSTQVLICVQNNYNYYPMFTCEDRYLYKGNGTQYYVGKNCSPPIPHGQVVENLSYTLNQQLYLCYASPLDSAVAGCPDPPSLTVTQGGLYTISWNGTLIPPDPKNGTPCPAISGKK